jgi:XTP/dITP diphosphohydrolase
VSCLLDSPRIVLVQASPRTAPGVLTWAAWEALREAPLVSLRPFHPTWGTALADAGVQVVPGGEIRAGDAWFDPVGDDELVSTLAGAAVTLGIELEVVMGSYDLPGARVLDLVATMDRLRSPGGCPWDAEQTHASLLQYLVEEAYEVVEAVEAGDRVHLREELGDLLLQVVFHSRVAAEHPDEPFTVDDVATGIVDKLVRRHPHVFGSAHAATPEHVDATWEINKAAEKGRKSALDGIPAGLPALARAQKMLDRLERHGVAVALPEASDVGTRLLRDVAAARAEGTSAEEALRAALRDWEADVRAAERGG